MTAPLPLPEIPETIIPARPQPSRTNSLVLYGAAALLMFAPLAFGAVEPWAIFVVEFGAAILLVIWMLHQVRAGQISVAPNRVFAPMLAFAVLISLQLLPGASAYEHATSSALLRYTAYGIVCFLITQTLFRTTHVQRIATVLGIYGACLALFAALQGISSNGKIYWLRTPRFGGWIYGPYVNHNHYAGLMEMLAPIPLVFAFSKYAHGRKRWIAAAAAAFMGATIFLSGSRGGMTAFAAEIGIFFWLLFRERTRNRVVLLMGGFLLISLVSIAWIGGSEVSSRIATVTGNHRSQVTMDIRLKIDEDSLRMFAKRPILGWGLATFEYAYPEFRSFYTNSLVNAVHNDYLQVLVETGLLGFAITVWLLVAAIRPGLRKLRNWPSDVNGSVALAALLGISGILVHSFVDFNLQIPANAMLFYVLCTLAGMEPRFRNFRREHKHRTAVTDELPSENLSDLPI
ncbi:MAG TPA: O-antigen ligase family protein [Terriglobales bacterium]